MRTDNGFSREKFLYTYLYHYLNSAVFLCNIYFLVSQQPLKLNKGRLVMNFGPSAMICVVSCTVAETHSNKVGRLLRCNGLFKKKRRSQSLLLVENNKILLNLFF